MELTTSLSKCRWSEFASIVRNKLIFIKLCFTKSTPFAFGLLRKILHRSSSNKQPSYWTLRIFFLNYVCVIISYVKSKCAFRIKIKLFVLAYYFIIGVFLILVLFIYFFNAFVMVCNFMILEFLISTVCFTFSVIVLMPMLMHL